jgi:hypothetical protein
MILSKSECFEQGSHFAHEMPEGPPGALKSAMQDDLMNKHFKRKPTDKEDPVVVHPKSNRWDQQAGLFIP